MFTREGAEDDRVVLGFFQLPKDTLTKSALLLRFVGSEVGYRRYSVLISSRRHGRTRERHHQDRS